MLEVLGLCLKFNKISNGYFDPRIIGNLEKIGYNKDFKKMDFTGRGKEIKMENIEGELGKDLLINKENKTVLVKERIDATGIAKGYTVDQAANFLENQGFLNFLADAGGDIYTKGKNNEGGKWRIAIEGMGENKLMLEIENERVATSGISRKRWKTGGRKFHHLINPKNPDIFSFDVKTVTVIAEKTVEADGRAKALVLMGKEKGMEFANKNNLKALFLDYRGNVYLSKNIKNNIFRNY